MEPIPSEKLVALHSEPSAPAEYIDWIVEHGWGDVSNGRYMLYDGLISLNEIIPDAPPGYFTFGDDMAGCNGCFSKACDGLIYEYDSGECEIYPTGKKFGDFIDAYL